MVCLCTLRFAMSALTSQTIERAVQRYATPMLKISFIGVCQKIRFLSRIGSFFCRSPHDGNHLEPLHPISDSIPVVL